MDVERRSLLKGLAAGLTGAAITPTPSEAHDGGVSGSGADVQQARLATRAPAYRACSTRISAPPSRAWPI